MLFERGQSPEVQIQKIKTELLVSVGEPLLSIPLRLHKQGKQTLALLDTGASANFIEVRIARTLHLKPQKLVTNRKVSGAWGSTMNITHFVKVRFHYDGSSYEEVFYVLPTQLPRPIILGLPFLRTNPELLQALLPKPGSDSESLSFISPRRARKMLKCPDNEAFLLWVSDSDQPVSSSLPNEILEQYGDVVVDELPKLEGGTTSSTPTIQHYVTLKPDAAPVAKRAYRLSPADQAELEKQLKELIADEKIVPSDSPFASPILFVKKKDGSKRLCVDYRALNEITVKSRFPLPLIEDVLDNLRGATVFSKLDLISGYHQVSINPPDRHKTAFITSHGQYSWNVMPFGLTNAPATFQRLMNHVLRDEIHKICEVYLDDILIFSKNEEEHRRHLDIVLSKLRKHQLFAKRSKCHFFLKQVQFLGHVISQSGIAVDPEKTTAITNWPMLKTFKDAQRFLGLTGYYRRFIKDFSAIAKPLHEFAAKKSPWSNECVDAFNRLKECLTSPPVLLPFDPSCDLVLTTDASSNCIGAVLELHSAGKCLGAVAYMSHLLHDNEIQWPIREKELFAVIFAFRKWRHYLLGSHVVVQTDHQSLQYLQLGKAHNDNQRVARWWDFLADYDYEIRYIPGTKNHVDALSRVPTEVLTALNVSSFELSPATITTLQQEYTADAFFSRVLHALNNPQEIPDADLRSRITNFSLHEGILRYRHAPGLPERTCLPKGTIRQKVLRHHHDSASASHPGPMRTLQALILYFYWPGMEADVKSYCSTCDACQHNKHPVLAPPGVFHPLPIPNARWASISIDFLTGLPTSYDADAILVVVDRLTKMAHFIRTNKTATANDTADLLVDHVIKHHGTPVSIVSDQDIVLTSQYWQRFCQRLNIHLEFTSSYNPSANGQVERLNRTLVEMLRHYCAEHPSEWALLLPTAEFAYNNSYQVSIQCTPFFANTGYHPRMPGFHNLITSAGLQETAPIGSELRDLDDYAVRQQTTLLFFQERLAHAQSHQALVYNTHHRSVHFKAGDLVLVHRDAYFPQLTAGQKLHHIWYGPFPVTHYERQNCTLQLPQQRNRRDTTVHVKFLRHYNSRLQSAATAPPVTVDQIQERANDVVSIVRYCTNPPCAEVQWNNAESHDTSWIPIAPLRDHPKFLSLLDDFDGLNTTHGHNRFRKHR